MAKTQSITRFYIRHYRDNGQTTAYCEWAGGGRTEGNEHHCDNFHECCREDAHFGAHMTALARRAIRAGLTIETEVW